MKKIIFLILFLSSFGYTQTEFPIRVGGVKQAAVYADSSAWYKKMILRDTLIIQKVIQFPAGSYGTATLNLVGDSIRVFVIGGMNPNAKVLASWHGLNFLGELGVRNRTIEGFTIFSNTDEFNNIEVIYLLLGHKIILP